ncbi:efflux RND transporter periplasmic adaptor subunit [endosymbiont 'TC1' of Trimyema compressum]|uniref:efflux RND transporter periplasmic adaptor subunit n=1 Tax=endosymbiont 'TC1' of Trimyema compressum TaxID=243899 RepID=UPI0013924333|nr:efflux RND transporter periplasmic adaptor subunit [endosymbiont 'TC1' of Trimyema compressum]
MSRDKGSVKNKIWFRILIAVVVIGVFSGVGYLAANVLLKNNQQAEVVAPVKPQNGIPVEIGSVSKTINVTGNLLPAQQESISAENGATIDKVYYGVGDRIEKGWKVIDMTTDGTKSNVTNASNPIQQNSSEKESVTLRTHINGKVEEVNVISKQVVTDVTKPAILIIDDSPYTLRTTINETDIVSVFSNQTANIRLKAFPDRVFTGKVKQVDGTGTVGTNGKTSYDVQIVLDEVDSDFKTGMTGEADLFAANVENVLRLPLNSIVLTGNGKGELI